MIKAGIIGVTGYTGIELLRLLNQHPLVTVTQAITDSHVGKMITDVYPHLSQQITLQGTKLDLSTINASCDMVFLALPHSHAIELVPQLLANKKRVIDLSADFRLRNKAEYQHWYQHKPASDKILQSAVYGLPEFNHYKNRIAKSSLVANPGCYPTAILLGSYPAIHHGLVDPNECIFDAKSGISGAGRSLSLPTAFCEAHENVRAYQLAGLHRHTPEIEQELSMLAGRVVNVQFTPHCIPINRGIMVTAYFKLTKTISQDSALELYQQCYQHDPFVRIHAANKLPEIKHVSGSNFCDIGLQVDNRTRRLIVVSVIDNLIKGAAGQAIQNLNLMYCIPETTGLLQASNYP